MFTPADVSSSTMNIKYHLSLLVSESDWNSRTVLMVLPVIITGGAVFGGASAYTMYQGGKMLALPSSAKEAPPKSFLGNAVGAVAAVAAYSGQNRILNQQFAHLLTYEVPAKVEHWGFRDFLRVTGPFIATRVAMVSVSVAVMGFVTTKVDVFRTQK